MFQKKIFLKSVRILSLSTIASRCLGLLREILTAHFFGTTSVSDSFILALLLPNFLKNFLSESTLQYSFIPIFLDHSKQGNKKNAFDMSRIFFHLVFWTVGLLGCLFFILLSVINHYCDISPNTHLTIRLIQWILPYVFLMALCFVMIAILNAHQKFFLSSMSPIILNIFWILSFFIFCPYFGSNPEEKIFGLVFALSLSGIIQVILYFTATSLLGFRIFPISLNIKNPGIKKMKVVMLPLIGIFMLNQLNGFIDIIWAHFLGKGIQSSLWYAQKLIYCPLGIFAVAVSIAILPKLSLHRSSQNIPQLKKDLLYGIKIILMIIVPCSFFMLILKKEIISLFFERGHFNNISVQKTVLPLKYYSFGLTFFALNKILLTVYYSFQNPTKPLKIACFSTMLNFILNALLIPFFGHGGLALATSLTALFSTGLLLKGIFKKIGPFTDKNSFKNLYKIVFATLFSGFFSFLGLKMMQSISIKTLFLKFALLCVPLLLWGSSLLFFYYIFGMKDLFILLKQRNSSESS